MRKGAVQGRQQPLAIHRFDQIVVGPELGDLHSTTDIVIRGDHDDGQRRKAASEFLEDFDTIDLGHHEIEKDGIRRRPGTGENFGAGGKTVDPIAGFGDDEGQQFPNRRIVINYPD